MLNLDGFIDERDEVARLGILSTMQRRHPHDLATTNCLRTPNSCTTGANVFALSTSRPNTPRKGKLSPFAHGARQVGAPWSEESRSCFSEVGDLTDHRASGAQKLSCPPCAQSHSNQTNATHDIKAEGKGFQFASKVLQRYRRFVYVRAYFRRPLRSELTRPPFLSFCLTQDYPY